MKEEEIERKQDRGMRRVAAHPRLDARYLAGEPALDPFQRVEEIARVKEFFCKRGVEA